MKSFLIFIFFAFMASFLVAQTEESCNPHPLSDDLILPMPNGLKMVFRPVWLGVGEAPFALREFLLGSRAGEGFRETPTKVQLGGSFLSEKEGKRDWLYYIGKYEVSEEQFNAVIPSSAVVTQNTSLGGFPKTKVTAFSADDFLQRYNLWLFANAKAALPELDGSIAFVRLPTEAEWEFAARGGNAVDAGRFDQRTPYFGDLARYEWFAGVRSSHNKLKHIGLLDPNPLGLHDMLGNVAEMVCHLYQIEYVQGRIGGLVIRGGNFLTDEKEMRSSLRTEQPPYGSDFQPASSEVTGFRVVLGSSVFTSIEAGNRLANEWSNYAKTRSVPMPASLGIAPVADQANAELRDTAGILHNLQDELQLNGLISAKVQAQINLLESSFGDIQSGINRAEKQYAEAGVLLTSISANLIMVSFKKISALEDYLKNGEHEEDQADLEILKINLADAIARYQIGLQLLNNVREDVVLQAYDSWIKELLKRNIPQQVTATKIAKLHYVQYAHTKGLDMAQWLKDFHNY